MTNKETIALLETLLKKRKEIKTSELPKLIYTYEAASKIEKVWEEYHSNMEETCPEIIYSFRKEIIKRLKSYFEKTFEVDITKPFTLIVSNVLQGKKVITNPIGFDSLELNKPSQNGEYELFELLKLHNIGIPIKKIEENINKLKKEDPEATCLLDSKEIDYILQEIKIQKADD